MTRRAKYHVDVRYGFPHAAWARVTSFHFLPNALNTAKDLAAKRIEGDPAEGAYVYPHVRLRYRHRTLVQWKHNSWVS